MSSIYLIRHGQASFGAQNYDQLSELGMNQARILGEALKQRGQQIDQVYLGDMQRHEQTAINCLKGFSGSGSSSGEQITLDDCDAIYDQGLNEYDHEQVLLMSLPKLSSMQEVMALVARQTEPKTAFREYFSKAVARWMSGAHDEDYSESWIDFAQRVQSAKQRILENRTAAQNILVFTSGGPISVISQSLLGVPKDQMLKLNWTLLNCGITKLVKTSSGVFLASLNEHAHFEGRQRKHLITYT